MTEASNRPDGLSTEAEDDEIGLIDLLIVLAKHKKLILGLPFVVAVIAAGFSLSLHNIFTASTKIFPPQQSQSASSAMLAQLGGLASLVGGAAGIRGANDLYIAMLNSRTVADNIIQRFGLEKRWEIDVKYPSNARKRLASVTKIASGKDGIITIEVDDEDPKQAADLANAYVDELMKLTQVLAVTEASQRRLFFERQLAQAKQNLANAETAAQQALERGGIVKVDEQGRSMVEITARLRGQISVKEVQIGAMRTFAADGNSDLQRAQEDLESMKRELAKIEGGGGAKSAANAPSGQGTESLRLLRNVKYDEVIVDLLAKQYELAKIDEARDSSVIQVLDKAIAPDQRSRPNRRNIVLLSAVAALFAAVMWAFILEALARTRSDPEQAARIQAFKRYLTSR